METLRIESRAVLAQTWTLLRRAPGLSLAALVVLVGLDTLSDTLGVAWSPLGIVSGVVSILFQLLIMRALLDSLDLRDRDANGGFFALLGLGIISGAGIILGFILLVVPGIFLFVRWSLSAAFLLAEDIGPSDAMRRSWEATQGNFGAVLAPLVIVYSPALALAIAIGLLFDPGIAANLTVSSVFNLLLEGVIIVGWHLQVALYSAARNGHSGERGIVEVFA